jgi:DNA-binding CsgD family transcriptional regulator
VGVHKSAARNGASRHRLAPQEAPQRPLRIVEDAREEPAGRAPTRCDVRLLSSRDAVDGSDASAEGRDLTAIVILRDATAADVLSCVRAATRGGGSVSPELLDRLHAASESSSADAAGLELSEREYEVLRMLADGETTRGIATRLSYSERTVKNIVRDMLDKLNCKTRAHAVALAARQGVI